MCACGTTQNRTHKDVFAYFSGQRKTNPKFDHAIDAGTGIFIVADPETGIMEAKKIHVRDLTYKETVKRGGNCIAYAFVPNEMMSFEKVSSLVCSGSCKVTDDCENGCACGGFGCY